MIIIIGLALVVLGLVIGFIVAWAFGAGASLNLFVGMLLVAAGAIAGFISEWLIDEAYRKNRELRWQLTKGGSTTLALSANLGGESDDLASEALMADLLRQREDELRELRDRISVADDQLDALRDEFEVYQQTHPDDLTVIKGVGAVYQWKLRDAGFNSYKQLAAADTEQLRRMLDIKNWQRVNVEDWIEQARDWAQRSQ